MNIRLFDYKSIKKKLQKKRKYSNFNSKVTCQNFGRLLLIVRPDKLIKLVLKFLNDSKEKKIVIIKLYLLNPISDIIIVAVY